MRTACALLCLCACALPEHPSLPTEEGVPTDPTSHSSDPELGDEPTLTADTDEEVVEDEEEPTEGVVDTGLPYEPADPSTLPRGLAWVRTNPMQVSGLINTVEMPDATVADAEEYYDDFEASAAHFWQDAPPTILEDWDAFGHPDHRWISWVHVDGTGLWDAEQRVIGGMPADSPGRIGWQVGDEPRNMAELDEIIAGIDAVRAADPDALIWCNFGNPDNQADMGPMLEHYATASDGDLVSYDDYVQSYNGVYENLEEHRRAALDHDMPYWRYLWGYTDPSRSDPPEESDLRFDAMVGLVYGYTGHTWFLYKIMGPPHTDLVSTFFETDGWGATPTWRFDVAAQLNRELKNLGRSIVMLTSTDVRTVPSVPLLPPDGTTEWSPGAGGDPYLVAIEPFDLGPLDFQDTNVGFFTDDNGEIYVMLQNANHQAADWPLYTRDRAWFRATFDFASAPPGVDVTRVRTLNARTGAVEDLPLVHVGGSRAALEIQLDAGDVVLFKYATGMPFALQP
jgi:hypothetical protein